MTRSPDPFGHDWRNRALPGQGPAIYCSNCGARDNTPEAEQRCVDVQQQQRPAEVQRDYDPFRP